MSQPIEFNSKKYKITSSSGRRGANRNGGITNNKNVPKQSDILVGLAREKLALMFKNQLKECCAVVEMNGVYEVIQMESERFSLALRHLWAEYNRSENRPQIAAIQKSAIEQAIFTLKSEVNYGDVPELETHLRIAWKQDGIIRYDLCNDKWEQVEIRPSEDGRSGVRIIDSRAMVKEISSWKESNYDPAKKPVLFRRYTVNAPQIKPDMNFDDDRIFDRFINSTNVTANKSSQMAIEQATYFKSEGSLSPGEKTLLAKADILIKFIPGIAKFLNNIMGSERSMKTTYLESVKSLVDPIIGGKLFSPRIDEKEIEQIFAHNYFVCFDNAKEVPDSLSNMICSVVSGMAVQSRRIYTSQEIVHLNLKCCVAVTSIKRAFYNQDAVKRSVNFEFLPVEDKNYRDETVVREEFEKIKPKILGYIFSTISKARLIKDRIKGEYSLTNMPAALEWGEALNQAMHGSGAAGMFIDTYKKLDVIQLTQTLGFDPLVRVYTRMYNDVFEKHKDDDNRDDDSYGLTLQRGYREYSFSEIHPILSSYAAKEGISTKKGNKQWPKDNHSLAEHTRRISSVLLDTEGFSVVVDYGAHKETIYILGTKQGLERYRRRKAASTDGKEGGTNKKDEAVIGKETVETAVDKSASTLERPMEDLARLAAKQNNIVAVDPGNNWKQRESRKVRSMRDEQEERKRKGEERREQIEEKIGEGGGNGSGYATIKTGGDGIKVKIDIRRVDRIFILQK